MIKKIKKKFWQILVRKLRKTKIYPFIYFSYWHSIFFKKNGSFKKQGLNYFTAIPNVGAGIGHQLANWIAGYWFAKQFNLNFAHIAFSDPNWESFLGFGKDEILASYLLKERGYKKVLLPLFDKHNQDEVQTINNIINSYSDIDVVFFAEQDQGYDDQYGVINEIKSKFYSSQMREKDKIIYNNSCFNIAVHVRRGDITIGQLNQNPNLLMRWQSNDYFEKVLESVLEIVKSPKPISIYLFSQGKEEDFISFKHFENLHFCLDMNAHDSFLHMVYADLLITSKSSFSYKPALLSNGIKVVPDNFWHGYPNSSDWIKVNNNGVFDKEKLSELFN